MGTMTSPAPPRLISAEDFLDMPESVGAELVDGEIVEVPMGSMSSWIGGLLYTSMLQFVLANNLGRVFPQENGMAIWPSNPYRVRKPDLTFVRKGRLPGGLPPSGWLTVVPDLVVEVVSPRDRVEDLEQKLLEYREAGIPLVWVIFPATRSAHVLAAARPRAEVAPNGTLDGEEVLPGFTCNLAELFERAERLD
jgi:Uma2 family endonuclease